MSLIITGASGQLGRQAAELLLERVDSAEIILVTRDPAALGRLAARGMTVRYGNFDQPQSLPGAFAGARRMLLIGTGDVGARVAQHGRAIAAAAAAGVRHIGYVSAASASEHHPVLAVREHHQTERMLRDSGLAWTFLRNSLYSELEVAAFEEATASSMFVTNRGEGSVAFVSREDAAGAAAAWLAGVPGSEGRVYDVTGPTLVSPADEAALFGELSGQPVELIHVDDEAFAGRSAALSATPREIAHAAAALGRAVRENYLATVSDAVEVLTGRPPRPLREVLERAAAALRGRHADGPLSGGRRAPRDAAAYADSGHAR